MIYKASQIQEHQLNKIVGRSISFNLKELKATGSSGLFLKFLINHGDPSNSLELNSKCNVENRMNGIIIRSNYSNQQSVLPIPIDDIIEIKLIKGFENTDLNTFSLGNVFHKIGLPLRYARYFATSHYFNGYKIDPMELVIKSKLYELNFYSNGYNYENQLDFWKVSSVASKVIMFDKNEEWNSNFD